MTTQAPTCPLCSAPPGCDCPEDLVRLVVDSLAAAELALRPVKIKLRALHRQFAEKDAQIEQLRMALTDAEETIEAFQDASGLLVGGDPGGVSPDVLRTHVQRQDRMIAAWHKVARKYREEASRIRQAALPERIEAIRKRVVGLDPDASPCTDLLDARELLDAVRVLTADREQLRQEVLTVQRLLVGKVMQADEQIDRKRPHLLAADPSRRTSIVPPRAPLPPASALPAASNERDAAGEEEVRRGS